MPEQLTIATYNVWGEGEGVHAFEARRRLIAETVASVRPDVVCIQEAPDAEFVRDLTEYLMRIQKRVLRSACTRLVRSDGWSEYIGVIHTGTNRVARVVEGPGGERVALGIDLLQPRVRVFSVHLDARAAEARLAEAERLAAVLADGTPAVVAGDFNEGPGSKALQVLCPPLDRLAPGDEVEWTAPTLPAGAQEARTVRDYVLGSGVAVVDSGVAGGEPADGIWPSDHVMVWARLSLE